MFQGPNNDLHGWFRTKHNPQWSLASPGGAISSLWLEGWSTFLILKLIGAGFPQNLAHMLFKNVYEGLNIQKCEWRPKYSKICMKSWMLENVLKAQMLENVHECLNCLKMYKKAQMLFPKCIYPKCIFAKCTPLACLPSFIQGVHQSGHWCWEGGEECGICPQGGLSENILECGNYHPENFY